MNYGSVALVAETFTEIHRLFSYLQATIHYCGSDIYDPHVDYVQILKSVHSNKAVQQGVPGLNLLALG